GSIPFARSIFAPAAVVIGWQWGFHINVPLSVLSIGRGYIRDGRGTGSTPMQATHDQTRHVVRRGRSPNLGSLRSHPATPWTQTVGRGYIRDGRGAGPAPTQATRAQTRHVVWPRLRRGPSKAVTVASDQGFGESLNGAFQRFEVVASLQRRHQAPSGMSVGNLAQFLPDPEEVLVLEPKLRQWVGVVAIETGRDQNELGLESRHPRQKLRQPGAAKGIAVGAGRECGVVRVGGQGFLRIACARVLRRLV